MARDREGVTHLPLTTCPHTNMTLVQSKRAEKYEILYITQIQFAPKAPRNTLNTVVKATVSVVHTFVFCYAKVAAV